MSFQDETKDIVRWIVGIPPAVKWGIKICVLAALLLAAAPGSLNGPLILLLFWTCYSLESRTLTFYQLLLFAVAGFIGILPAAAVVESLFMLFAAKESWWSLGLSVLVEAGLMLALLAGLSLWPKSRMRLTASLSDFILAGLWIGAGLEWAILFLQANGSGHQGMTLGILPQLPGIFGRPDVPAACASPTSWGLLLGLLVGLSRYLFGPNFKNNLIRQILAGLGGLLIVLLAAERIGFAFGSPNGIWGFLYWVDLKGRLLAYITALLAFLAIVIDWMLLQSRPEAESLKKPVQDFIAIWKNLPFKQWPAAWQNSLNLQYDRCRLRELAAGSEIRPLLSGPEAAELDRRIALIRSLFIAEKGAVHGPGQNSPSH